jgi:hypothetical protein
MTTGNEGVRIGFGIIGHDLIGYFLVDHKYPSFCYTPIAEGKTPKDCPGRTATGSPKKSAWHPWKPKMGQDRWRRRLVDLGWSTKNSEPCKALQN